MVANDLPFESYIKLQKQDKETGKFVTYSNATFALYMQNTDTKQWERVKCKVGDKYFDSWTTNSEGIAKTETKLPAGKFKVEELRIPTGFIQIDGELTFEISRKNPTLDYDQDLDAWITVTVKNEQPKANIILDKSVALREGVDTSLVDISDLSKIKFKLIAKEDIIDYADGSVIYKAGQEIKQYNLSKEGNLKISNIPLGKYQLQEIETLPGLVLDNTKYDVIIEQKDTTTKVYTVNKEIVNDTTAVEFSKTDITGDKELPGAKLTVLDENGKVIDSWTSTDRTHIIEGLETNKNYLLREEIAPDSYVKATDVPFRVDNNNQIQKVQMIDKQVVMSKTDVGEKEVEGAELKVVDEQGNIVDSWTSGKESHIIKGLEENKRYFLYEDYAPEGFVISNSVEFFVTTDKETQLVQMVDKQLFALKTDVDGNPIEGATLTVTSTKTKNIVDKWVSEKTPHAVSGLIETESYILHEEIVVDGFVKAKDIEFTVTPDKETQEIVMVDKVVSVSKTDLVTGEELPGAELEITDKDGNVIDKWVSTDTPHNVTGLEEGKEYILTERTCPYGYEQAESITFTVSEEKVNQLVEMKDMPILKTIKVVKADSDTKELIKEDFTFGIFEDPECTKLIKEVKSDKENATVTFEDMRYGTFYVKELKAPKNYQLSDKVVKIEINDKGTFADGELLEDNDSVCTFTYYNKMIPKIQTGNETNYLLLVGSIIISLLEIGTGIIILKKKKQTNN